MAAARVIAATPATFTRNSYKLSDDIDIIRGKHHFILGAELMQMRMEEVNISVVNGEFVQARE